MKKFLIPVIFFSLLCSAFGQTKFDYSTQVKNVPSGGGPAGTSFNFVFDGDSRTCGTGATYGPACSSEPYTIPAGGYIAATTGTASSGSTALTVASGTGIVNGQLVVGVGIAPATTVANVSGTSVTLSAATTAALSTTAVSFGATDYPSQAMRLPIFSGHGTGINVGVGGNSCGQISARYSTDAHTFSPAVTGKPGYFFLNCGTNDEGVVTPTATGTNGQSTITVSSTSGIDVGFSVTGTGIGSNALVAATWNGTTTVPLTVANSGTVSGTMTITPSTSAVFTNIAAIWALAKADGYLVVASTNPNHANTSQFRIMNDAYNALIRGARGTGSYDYLADDQLILNDVYDQTYYYTDNTHFTNLGYALWAQAAANALENSGTERFNMPLAGRYIVQGTGTSSTRLEENCLYVLTTGTSVGCAGFGTLSADTTGNYNWGFGDNVLTGVSDGAFNGAFGHGSGANIVHGSNNSLFDCSPTGDYSGTSCYGANSATSGSFATAIGYASTAIASSAAFGIGAIANASNAIILATGTQTNSTANTLQFQAFNFLDSSGNGTFLKIKTSTKCAAAGTGANPSVVSCSAAPTGSFSCATNASTGTCVVDTSEVTASSAIFVQPDSSLGTLLSVTCNTIADTGLTAPRVSARSAATSFTITLGTFSSNPECFNYWVVN